MTRHYYLLCATSGLLWAVIAYLIADGWGGAAFWGGFASAPLIGVVAGKIYRPVYRFPFSRRVAMSLLSLYISSTLFGLAWGITDVIQGLPGGVERNLIEVVYEAIAATFYGVTATGFVAFLWPLAHLNHWLVGRCVGHHALAGLPTGRPESLEQENQ